MSKNRFMKALTRDPEAVPACGSGTSTVSVELMEHTGAYFPQAHLDPEKMALLAGAAHTEYGYDVVMPLFSVWHESAALGCPMDWGEQKRMPDCREHIWKTDEDVRIPKDLLKRPGCAVPLKAIELLKKRLGEGAAVCGKVFGPWTLGYHVFGVQEFLMNTLLEPDMVKRAMEKLTEVTLTFARAQIDSGADCILLGDHATRDLCSPDAYREFLTVTHASITEEISVPVILHICGDTSDRIGMIAETGLDCFHWDTKLGPPEKARSLAGETMALMGGINNTELLRKGTPEEVKQAVRHAAKAGTDIIAPECAIPLDVPMVNMKAIGEAVEDIHQEKTKN